MGTWYYTGELCPDFYCSIQTKWGGMQSATRSQRAKSKPHVSELPQLSTYQLKTDLTVSYLAGARRKTGDHQAGQVVELTTVASIMCGAPSPRGNIALVFNAKNDVITAEDIMKPFAVGNNSDEYMYVPFS